MKTVPGMNDRIKLAVLMGATEVENTHNNWRMWEINGSRVVEPHLPDPYTDANDDYAVLEYFRGLHGTDNGQLWFDFLDALADIDEGVGTYQIGDYARAALKVIAAAEDKHE